MANSKAIAGAVIAVLVCIGVGLAWQQKVQRERQRRAAYVRAQKELAVRTEFIDNLPVIDLTDWCGRSPAEIAQRFFGGSAKIRDCCPDTLWGDAGVQNWHGWKQVSLSFAVNGLRDVTFEPPYPLTEAEFIRIAREKFGLDLPKANYTASDEFHGFVQLQGNVRSVELISATGRHESGVTMLVLASAPARQAFTPSDMQVTFNWYVDGAADRKKYNAPEPWK